MTVCSPSLSLKNFLDSWESDFTIGSIEDVNTVATAFYIVMSKRDKLQC